MRPTYLEAKTAKNDPMKLAVLMISTPAFTERGKSVAILRIAMSRVELYTFTGSMALKP